MPLETPTYIMDLVETNPPGTDARSQGDNHIRNIKLALKNTFPTATRAFNLRRWSEKEAAFETQAVDRNMLSTDDGKLEYFDCSGAARTYNLLAVASAPEGMTVFVDRDGSANDLTLDPAGVETINGASTIVLKANESGLLYRGASEWRFLMQDQRAATQALVNAGTDDTDFVTSLKLWNAKLRGGWRNIIGRCGGFEVWSHGTSIAVAAGSSGYTADGWSLATNASQNHTVSRQTGLRDGSQYCARVQRDAGQTGTAANTFQAALDTDELYRLRNKTCQLRFTVAAGSNWSPTNGALSYAIYSGTGAGPARRTVAYTGEVAGMNGTINLTPGGAAVDVASALGTLGAAITQATVFFAWTPTGTAGANDWFAVDDVHIEEAPVVPDFERRPLEAELASCRRHYLRISGFVGTIASGYNRSTTVQRVTISFKVPMRVAPTSINFVNAGSFSVIHGVTSTAVTNITFVDATTEAITLDITVAAGLTAGQGSLLATTNVNATLAVLGAEI